MCRSSSEENVAKNEVQTVVWALARFLLTRTQTTQNRQALAGLYGHTNTYYAVGCKPQTQDLLCADA